MSEQELREIQREHADIWRRIRLAETQDEGLGIIRELFDLWPYNRTEKNTEGKK